MQTLKPEDQKRLDRLAEVLERGADKPALLKAVDASLAWWRETLEGRPDALR
jgi:hypothetical protein